MCQKEGRHVFLHRRTNTPVGRVIRRGWVHPITSLGQFGKKGLKDLGLVLRGHAKIVRIYPARDVQNTSTDIIHVDRSIRPTYPDWARIVMHPDLEPIGPTEFDQTGTVASRRPEARPHRWEETRTSQRKKDARELSRATRFGRNPEKRHHLLPKTLPE